MDGYLKRIVTRSVGQQNIITFVRSASPSASEDQRIGMPGFDGLPSIDATPVPDDAGTVPSAPPAPSITAAGTQANRLQRKVSVPGAQDPGPSVSMASSVTPISRGPSIPRHSPDVKPESVLREQAREAFSPVTRSTSEVEPRQERRRPTPVTTAGLVRDDSVRPLNPSPMTEQSSPTLENQPQLLEPMPRVAPTPPQGPSGPGEQVSEQSQEQRPRVTIGRINVEVAPPAQEPARSAAVRPAPLTAASVSVIGPLSGRFRSSRVLSLRYR
ncbi:MAG: hypothetical protein ABIZ80_03265 [Bryobacteraceae bacterium]